MSEGVLAVDVGGTSVRIARFAGGADTPGPVVEWDTPPDAGALVDEIVDAARALEAPFTSAGVGIAALVDHDTGTLVWSPHFAGAMPLALGRELGSALGVPAMVDNDANAAALGEAIRGAGRGHRMVLMVTVGTGIGGGLVIDGRVERGRGFLGEIGHIPLDDADTPCQCGLLGCWEAVASGRALDRAAAALLGEEATGEDLVAIADADDAAGQALTAVARWFGVGLGALVNVLDPDVILVGGGVAGIGPAFLDPAVAAMAAGVTGAVARSPTPVVPAHFGASAGLVGAALMAHQGQRSFRAPP
ncbi:MAG TPA: ROK family protein [Acidimicrobiia bacterium]|nr:ROK family protein [Acidimicrobiia bacterium]